MRLVVCSSKGSSGNQEHHIPHCDTSISANILHACVAIEVAVAINAAVGGGVGDTQIAVQHNDNYEGVCQAVSILCARRGILPPSPTASTSPTPSIVTIPSTLHRSLWASHVVCALHNIDVSDGSELHVNVPTRALPSKSVVQEMWDVIIDSQGSTVAQTEATPSRRYRGAILSVAADNLTPRVLSLIAEQFPAGTKLLVHSSVGTYDAARSLLGTWATGHALHLTYSDSTDMEFVQACTDARVVIGRPHDAMLLLCGVLHGFAPAALHDGLVIGRVPHVKPPRAALPLTNWFLNEHVSVEWGGLPIWMFSIVAVCTVIPLVVAAAWYKPTRRAWQDASLTLYPATGAKGVWGWVQGTSLP